MLKDILNKFKQELSNTHELVSLDELKVVYLGKKQGIITEEFKKLNKLSSEERVNYAKNLNVIKVKINKLLGEKRDFLIDEELELSIKKEWLDPSLEKSSSKLGAMHPIPRIQFELEDIFSSLGFSILDGPFIENDYFNFEALNIPKSHPARDMQDTFYMKNGALLRTHTSAIQVRAMKSLKPPFRFIAPGKVFRVERTDAFHEASFHQLEGMVVGKDINISHLIATMKLVLAKIFKRKVNVRLRPGYFPFVEPGFELDIENIITKSSKKWLELMPCGMIHPNVLRAGGIDPKEYSGFAFGLGLDRLVMMRYDIDDIRHFHSGDLRFINQFK